MNDLGGEVARLRAGNEAYMLLWAARRLYLHKHGRPWMGPDAVEKILAALTTNDSKERGMTLGKTVSEEQVRAVLEAAMSVGPLPAWLAAPDGSKLNEDGLNDVINVLHDRT